MPPYILAPYRGQEVWFNSDGLLVGANQLHAGYANAIIAHQWGNGTQQNSIDQDYTLLVLIAKQRVAVPEEDVDQNASDAVPTIFGVSHTEQTGTVTPFFVTNFGDKIQFKTYDIKVNEKKALLTLIPQTRA